MVVKYKITGAYLCDTPKGRHCVIYSSVIDGQRYATTHDRAGLSDTEATGVLDKKEGYLHGRFRREHCRQVSEMLEKARAKSKIILN